MVPLSSTGPAYASEIATTDPPPIPSLNTIGSTHPPVQAHTYIWIKPVNQLNPEIWNFADFVRTNAHKWVGDGPEARENQFYGEVDKRRDMGGVIVHHGIAAEDGEDGKKMKVVVEAETR